ncbi:MAG: chloride channel protein, CIC family [Chloroflexi bacterium]|jgi:CIC family chloride channel protein|nr:MAG: chloride channel protein, CIC family [Chloroflexota bacterium]
MSPTFLERPLVAALLRRFRPSPFSIGVALAVAVGALAGLASVAFDYLIDIFDTLFFDVLLDGFSSLGRYDVLLLPAIGGLIVGPMIYFLAREVRGSGIPEVMLAVARDGGRIRSRVSLVKILSTSVSIGSGASVGREGPIVQIGSSMGSFLGQRFGVSEGWLKILVACGAAGGISATFNAPIAGVFFALEVVLRTFSLQNFGVVVISSVTASAVAVGAFGDFRAFTVPVYGLNHPAELGLFALLGVGAALLALGFMQAIKIVEGGFSRSHLPDYLKPAIGGLGVGVIGVFYPEVFGVGYEVITEALVDGLPLLLLLALIFLKPLATSLAIGSGSTGGVFAPSLFLGAIAGAGFGELMGDAFPGIAGDPGGYGLAGMAGVFAAAASAPMTALLIVFEMSRSYSMVVPLMLTVVISTAISRKLSRESIYTARLIRRGLDLRRFLRFDPAWNVKTWEVMTRDYPTIQASASIDEVLQTFEKTGVHGLPVLEDGNLVGIVTATDVEQAMMTESEARSAGDIATRSLVTAQRDQTIAEVMEKLGAREVGYIPVVDAQEPLRLLGVLRRQDIIRAYAMAAQRTREEHESSA